MFNILFLFVIIPVLTLGALFLTRNVKQVRAVAATGASLLLIAAAYLCYEFVGACRQSGRTDALHRQLYVV